MVAHHAGQPATTGASAHPTTPTGHAGRDLGKAAAGATPRRPASTTPTPGEQQRTAHHAGEPAAATTLEEQQRAQHHAGAQPSRAEIRAALRSMQGNRCPICGEPDPTDIDHCHATGLVRGLLHTGCNIRVGVAETGLNTGRTLVREVNTYLEHPPAEGLGWVWEIPRDSQRAHGKPTRTVLLPQMLTPQPAETANTVLLSTISNTPRRQAPNKGRKFPGEVYTDAEIAALLRQCSQRAPTGIRNRALIVVMYRAGLRVGEALALRLADIDFARGTIRVRNGKGRKARTVGVDDGALAVLQRWADTRRNLGFRNGPLFCTLQGTQVSDRYVRDMLKRLAGHAEIDKRVHPHGFRHTHAAELADEGTPVNVVQQQLGHSNVAVTSRYLDHIAPAQVIALGRRRTWQPGP